MSEGEINVDSTKMPEQPPLTEQQKLARQKQIQKEAAVQLANYKKRLEEGVKLKRLQVEELELNIKYFEAKVAWKALQPEIEELEAQEQAEMKKLEESQRQSMKLKSKPDITTVKTGKPRKSE